MFPLLHSIQFSPILCHTEIQTRAYKLCLNIFLLHISAEPLSLFTEMHGLLKLNASHPLELFWSAQLLGQSWGYWGKRHGKVLCSMWKAKTSYIFWLVFVPYNPGNTSSLCTAGLQGFNAPTDPCGSRQLRICLYLLTCCLQFFSFPGSSNWSDLVRKWQSVWAHSSIPASIWCSLSSFIFHPLISSFSLILRASLEQVIQASEASCTEKPCSSPSAQEADRSIQLAEPGGCCLSWAALDAPVHCPSVLLLSPPAPHPFTLAPSSRSLTFFAPHQAQRAPLEECSREVLGVLMLGCHM